MQPLNLPAYEFRFREEGGVLRIFDEVRRKFLVLTPEEWVRQNFVRFLTAEKKFPRSLLALEVGLKYNTLARRADILVYDRTGSPFLMVECKAATVPISQDTFDQLARYNMAFHVPYLVVTNGLVHYCCRMDYTDNSFQYQQDLPAFPD